MSVTLERDLVPRAVEVPRELATALGKSRTAEAAFAELSFTHQKEYVRWIESAKKPQTRDARIARAIDMLHAGRRTPDA